MLMGTVPISSGGEMLSVKLTTTVTTRRSFSWELGSGWYVSTPLLVRVAVPCIGGIVMPGAMVPGRAPLREAPIWRLPGMSSAMGRVDGGGRFSVAPGGAGTGGLDVAVNLEMAFVTIRRRSMASI